MDGSTYPVVGPRPGLQGARALVVALILAGTFAASFAMGRLTAGWDDGNPTAPGTPQVAPYVAYDPPHGDGVVKQG